MKVIILAKNYNKLLLYAEAQELVSLSSQLQKIPRNDTENPSKNSNQHSSTKISRSVLSTSG